MGFRLVPISVTLNDLNGVMAVTLRYFTEFGKPALQKTIMWRNLCKSLLYFVVRVQCCRKESSRSLSHLLMSFLLILLTYIMQVVCFVHVQSNIVHFLFAQSGRRKMQDYTMTDGYLRSYFAHSSVTS